MKAMIFAAGLGTRLKPITDDKPKALVEYKGVPLLERILMRLIEAGVNEVIINLHHFPEQIKQFLGKKNHFGIQIEFSEEKTLLDTGGGLLQAAYFFDDGQPFFVHNVDIVSDIDLVKMMATHRRDRPLATLAVMQRETSRYLMFDETGLLGGWKSVKDKREIIVRPGATLQDWAFCGIHVISPAIFEKFTERGVFSIIRSYLRLAEAGEKIQAYPVYGCEWRDVGKVGELEG